MSHKWGRGRRRDVFVDDSMGFAKPKRLLSRAGPLASHTQALAYAVHSYSEGRSRKAIASRAPLSIALTAVVVATVAT